jgi:hypothetical protein
MKRLLHIALILLITIPAMAQRGPNKERIHAIKIGFITDRLNLSSKEADAFWPLYNSYDDEYMALRHEYRQKYIKKNRGHLDPKQAQEFIDDDIDYREKMVDLRKKYKDEFLKVISPTKLAELYQAESDFKDMLIKRLEQRRNNGGSPGMRGR